MTSPSPWPNLSNQPFQKAPQWADNVQVNALAIYGGIANAYVEGFKAAGDKLVETIASNEDNPDVFMMPVVYLYRHYLELQLKAMLQEGRDKGARSVSDMTDDWLKKTAGHNLNTLWNYARKLIEERWPEGSTVDLCNAEKIIMSFHHLDQRGQVFRYAHDFTSIPPLIDLQHLARVIDSLDRFLNASMSD